MSANLKKDKRPPVRIQLKKNDQVKVIAGRDKGKTGRVLDVDQTTGRILVEHVNMVKRHTKQEPGQADCRRHRGKGSADRGFERDDPVREVRAGADRASRDRSSGGKTRRTRICRKCGQALDKK